MQSIRGLGLLVKQACEVMLRNSTLLAAFLKEEACNGCLNKAVLVLRLCPFRPLPWFTGVCPPLVEGCRGGESY